MSYTPSNLDTRSSLLRDLVDPEKREEAWRVFLARYSPLIEGWCRARGLQPCDVQDIASTVLLKLVKAMPTFVYEPERGGFRPWLRTVVLNTVRNFWRDQASRPTDVGSNIELLRGMTLAELEDSVEELVTALNVRMEAEQQRAKAAMKIAQDAVAPATWRAFEATVIDGLSGPEAAEMLKVPVGRVYIYKKRVLDRIKAILNEHS